MISKTDYNCGVKLVDFICESNKIEGLEYPVPPEELQAAEKFLELSIITVDDLCGLVDVFESGAKLRDKYGMNVRVGGHFPPRGGPEITISLSLILFHLDDNPSRHTPYDVHRSYESLHPFTDGNGRSGRMLWLWMMNKSGNRMANLGFLHAWYYQSLEAMSL